MKATRATLNRLRLKARLTWRKPCAVLLLERLGDIVACGPVAQAFRQEHGRAFVVWICRPAFADLARAIPEVDEVLTLETLDEAAELMRAWPPGWHLVDLTLRGKQLANGSRWTKAAGDPAVTTETYYHHGALLEAMARGAGIGVPDAAPQLQLPASARAEVDALGLPPQYLVVHCASDESARNWNDAGWQALLEHCRPQLPVVLIDAKPAASLSLGQRDIDLGGRTSLLGTVEVIRRASLFIGIDSGPAHLANAVQTPGLILLGRYRVFHRYLPYTGFYGAGGGAVVVQYPLECPFLPWPVVQEHLDPLLAAVAARDPVRGRLIAVPAEPERFAPPVRGERITAATPAAAANLDGVASEASGSRRASGWAALPWAGRSPDYLIVARRDGSGLSVVAVEPFTRLERPDVAAHLGDPRLQFTGWAVPLPSGNDLVLLGFDCETGRGHWVADVAPPVSISS